MKKLILVGLLALTMGCSAIVADVKEFVGNDLAVTGTLADKYSKPEVRQCVDFLNATLNDEDTTLAKIDALIAEPTAGLISKGFKVFLLAELAKSLNDPAKQAAIEKGFDDNCAKVGGKLLFALARDARKIGSRGIGR